MTTITQRVLEQFRAELAACIDAAPERIAPSAELAQLMPWSTRREVWRRLAERGYVLPPLVLALPVRLASAASVLLRSAALAWFLQSAVFLIVVFPLGWLTWWMTRPWAVVPPAACRTVSEAAIHATSFRREDYEAGLWTDADLSAKVRAIMALQLGLSMDDVRPESRLADLRECL